MRTQSLPQMHEQRNKSRGEKEIDKNLLTPKLEKKIVDSIAILCQNLHVLCTWSWHKWINPVRSKQQYDESVYPLYIALHAITVSLLPGSSDMTLDFTSRRPDTTYDTDDFSSIYLLKEMTSLIAVTLYCTIRLSDGLWHYFLFSL